MLYPWLNSIVDHDFLSNLQHFLVPGSKQGSININIDGIKGWYHWLNSISDHDFSSKLQHFVDYGAMDYGPIQIYMAQLSARSILQYLINKIVRTLVYN